MTVEKVTASKRVPGRYYVDFYEGQTLRVTDILLAQYALSPDIELSESEFENLRQDAIDANARSRALRVLGSRMLSRAELARRLIRLGETEATAEDVAEWCEDIGLIDDAEYARQIVQSYSSQGYGPLKLRDELYKRLIPRELWDEALEALREESEETDAQRAAEFLAQKLRGKASDRDDKRRLGAALARRGFNWDDINEAFSIYAENADEDFDE